MGTAGLIACAQELLPPTGVGDVCIAGVHGKQHTQGCLCWLPYRCSSIQVSSTFLIATPKPVQSGNDARS